MENSSWDDGEGVPWALRSALLKNVVPPRGWALLLTTVTSSSRSSGVSHPPQQYLRAQYDKNGYVRQPTATAPTAVKATATIVAVVPMTGG
jgi:hypothetical protein